MKKGIPEEPHVVDRHFVDRQRAIAALAKAKAMEKKLKKKLVSVRLDDRTVLTTTADRVEYLAKEYRNTKPF